MIKIEGKTYKQTDIVSYSQSMGAYYTFVMVNNKEKVAVKRNGVWSFHVPAIAPPSCYQGM